MRIRLLLLSLLAFTSLLSAMGVWNGSAMLKDLDSPTNILSNVYGQAEPNEEKEDYEQFVHINGLVLKYVVPGFGFVWLLLESLGFMDRIVRMIEGSGSKTKR